MSAVRLTEAQVSATIQDGLRKMGYRVFSTTVRGFYGKPGGQGYGVDKGVPDLLVGHDSWGAVLMPLEVKGPKTPLSPEQTDLRLRGMLYVARSWDDAIESVDHFERTFGLPLLARRAMA